MTRTSSVLELTSKLSGLELLYVALLCCPGRSHLHILRSPRAHRAQPPWRGTPGEWAA